MSTISFSTYPLAVDFAEESCLPPAEPVTPLKAYSPADSRTGPATKVSQQTEKEVRTITLDCIGASQDNWLRAAVAVAAPVMGARKIGKDKLELKIDMPDHILQATGGEEAYKMHVYEMLKKMMALSRLQPELLSGALNSHDMHVIRVKVDKTSKRYYLSAKFENEGTAQLFKDRLGLSDAYHCPVWEKKDVEGKTFFTVESAPSTVIYRQIYNTHTVGNYTRAGESVIKEAVRQMVAEGEIAKPIIAPDFATHRPSAKKYLRVAFSEPRHADNAVSATDAAKKAWKRLARKFGIKFDEFRLIEDLHNRIGLLISEDAVARIGRQHQEQVDMETRLEYEQLIKYKNQSLAASGEPLSQVELLQARKVADDGPRAGLLAS